MSKTYQTSTPTDAARRAPHHNTPLEMTGLWSRAIGLLTAAGLFVALGLVGAVVLDAWQAAGLGLALALIVGVPGAILALYTRLEHGAAYGRRERATKSGDEWVINLKREIPVSDRGTVEMEPTRVKLPVEPRSFVDIVRQMKRTGTSRDKRPAGVGQPTWTKIMRALEEMGGAEKGPNGYEFTDDLDALLRDIDQW